MSIDENNQLHKESNSNTSSAPAETKGQDQLQTESKANVSPAPAQTNLIDENKFKTKDNSEQLQMEKEYSPASSLFYKTPPSSPQPDSISDLNEEDLPSIN